MMREKVGILTHRDVDGVCSAAIAKIAHSDAYVEFAEAYELASKLRALPTWDKVIVLDLGLSAAQKTKVKNAFKEASKSHRIIYIDHHRLPPGITRRTLPCDTFVHKANASCSELALDFFNPPASLHYIASLGAIGDYQEHTREMRRLIMKYGWRSMYLEEFLLEHAIEASRKDHPFKRGVIQGLAQGLLPSEIPNLLEQARFGVKRERTIENYVMKNCKKIGEKIAIVTDVPFMATGPAALYTVRIANAEIGIGSYQAGNYVHFSMRKDKKLDLNLNTLVTKTTLKISDSSGGGHVEAVGGRVPIRKFDTFLGQLKQEISELSS